MQQRLELNDFFISVQAKAFSQAMIAVGNREDALDIVQEAMIRLARKYADKESEWTLIFHRILQNLIRDWYRRQKVKKVFLWWDQTHETEEIIQGDNEHPSPEQQSEAEQTRIQINAALNQLPYRQQQAFLLRSWWGHKTSETAYIMRCSEGSVKTHYSRALQRLKQLLGDIAL
jgi:RNA polymerase sigma-70 factor (ECF subfamily)